MYTTAATARQLAAAVVKGLGAENRVTVAVCPPFPYLSQVAEVLRGSPVALGAQNMYCEKEGAFTGEVSPAMLADVGCRYVILGHSERRQLFGETDAIIAKKLHAALEAGLIPIVCVGETLDERTRNETEAVLERQFTGACAALTPDLFSRILLAYEPVWAIGTGRTATPEMASEAHRFLRGQAASRFSTERASALRILYGGSVKPDNIRGLMAQVDIDGGLVGGASLEPGSLAAIVNF
jgi:triosephosphate isomerase